MIGTVLVGVNALVIDGGPCWLPVLAVASVNALAEAEAEAEADDGRQCKRIGVGQRELWWPMGDYF